MILVDVNLLLYGTLDSLPEHEAARAWLEEKLNGVSGVGLPWASLLGFVRIASNPRVFERPMSVEAAWGYVEEWLALPSVFVPEPADRYPEILATLIPEAGKPELVPDARGAGHGVRSDAADDRPGLCPFQRAQVGGSPGMTGMEAGRAPIVAV